MSPRPLRAGTGPRAASVRGGRSPAGDSGLVTIELALGLIVFACFLLLGLSAISLGVDHLRCAEASRVGARLAARAESTAIVIAGAHQSAPEGSRITVGSEGANVVVTVRAPAPALLSRLGIPVAAVGRSVAPKEVPR